ncbi:AAA family ATPase [Streptomyces sp. LUP30]|uniref:AAA family ATPase n=1 Tax=Streptomyces sp. LUP30 TaxID=1890285 RepID=UPI000851D4FE|nr:AAA family ATPase [Streptomyces sp. LUP30]
MSALRIAVVAPAGTGKSTCAGLIAEFAGARGLSHARVKLAAPLYDLQAEVYRRAGAPLAEGAQDQLLMEALADALRRIRPTSLADDFTRRLASAPAQVVVNDDLRDPHVDAPVLRAHGFRVLRVTCDEDVRLKRLAERGDPTRADRSTREIDLITPDAVIDNSGDLDAYRTAVHDLLRSWL